MAGLIGYKSVDGVRLGVEGGPLFMLLRSPEYNLFTRSAVFESNFIQVTKEGEHVAVPDKPTFLTVGVTSTVPSLPLPNVLLIARTQSPSPNLPPKDTEGSHMEISRFLPLKLVQLSIHDKPKRILKLQLATSRTFYFQLHREYPALVFEMWDRLVHILRSGLSFTFKDPRTLVPLGSFCDENRSSSPTSNGDFASWSDNSTVNHGPRPSFWTFFDYAEDNSFATNSDHNIAHSEEDSKLQADMGENNGKRRGKVCHCSHCKRSQPHPAQTSEIAYEEETMESTPQNHDDPSYGVWDRDTPSGLVPLSRLNSLIATSRGLKPTD